jgi:hypothetical protein
MERADWNSLAELFKKLRAATSWLVNSFGIQTTCFQFQAIFPHLKKSRGLSALL